MPDIQNPEGRQPRIVWLGGDPLITSPATPASGRLTQQAIRACAPRPGPPGPGAEQDGRQ